MRVHFSTDKLDEHLRLMPIGTGATITITGRIVSRNEHEDMGDSCEFEVDHCDSCEVHRDGSNMELEGAKRHAMRTMGTLG